MIEIHHVRSEHFSAVGTRHATQVAKECKGRVLAPLHPIQLSLSVRRVVADVVGTLITRRPHDASLEHQFYLSNEQPNPRRVIIGACSPIPTSSARFPGSKTSPMRDSASSASMYGATSPSAIRRGPTSQRSRLIPRCR